MKDIFGGNLNIGSYPPIFRGINPPIDSRTMGGNPRFFSLIKVLGAITWESSPGGGVLKKGTNVGAFALKVNEGALGLRPKLGRIPPPPPSTGGTGGGPLHWIMVIYEK